MENTYTNLKLTAELEVVKFAIAQNPLNAHEKASSATFSLTPDSYTGGGTSIVTWSSTPIGITGSGTSITFNPSTLKPSEYVVTALRHCRHDTVPK